MFCFPHYRNEDSKPISASIRKLSFETSTSSMNNVKYERVKLEEVGQHFAEDHGASYQGTQSQRNRRTGRIFTVQAFLLILDTIVLEFRIFSPKKSIPSKMF